MARSSTMAPQQQQPSQPPQQQGYRTDPSRKASGFTPAQRVGGSSMPPRGNFLPRGSTFAPPMSGEEEAEIELVEGNQSQTPSSDQTQPLTKSGYPDRRYRGQRDLPPPEESIPYTRPRQGGMAGDVHVTVDGKPDRRFKENRALSDEDANRIWLDKLNEKYGRRR